MKKRIDWLDVKKILDHNNITTLYHFTDRSNLESIVKNKGIYSWGDCLRKSIYVKYPGGSDISHQLDEHEGLEDYVRVSICRNHPMMYYALNEGRIKEPVVLEIDLDLIYLNGVIFSDRNAVKKNSIKGESIEFLRNIHFQTAKTTHLYDVPENEREFYQAEILIPHFIPLQYIKNIGNYISTKDSRTTELTCKPRYDNGITSESPSAVFFLVSQSSHTRELAAYNGYESTHSQIFCDVINEILYNLVISNSDERFKSKYDIGIIGYHDFGYMCFPRSNGFFCNMNNLMEKSLGTKKLKKELKTRKGIKSIETEVPTWVKAQAHYGANLAEALRYCYKAVLSWVKIHPNSYPPTVIHITDSGYQDEDESELISLANDIKMISTNNGNTIFINLIVEDVESLSNCVFPEFANEQDREFSVIDIYYRMSSYLPCTFKSLPYINDSINDHIGIAYNLRPKDLYSILESIIR